MGRDWTRENLKESVFLCLLQEKMHPSNKNENTLGPGGCREDEAAVGWLLPHTNEVGKQMSTNTSELQKHLLTLP